MNSLKIITEIGHRYIRKVILFLVCVRFILLAPNNVFFCYDETMYLSLYYILCRGIVAKWSRLWGVFDSNHKWTKFISFSIEGRWFPSTTPILSTIKKNKPLRNSTKVALKSRFKHLQSTKKYILRLTWQLIIHKVTMLLLVFASTDIIKSVIQIFED